MQKLRVENFTVSIDGFGAGSNQNLENPLGNRGTELHKWFYPTETFQKYVLGKDGGTTDIDNDFAKRGFDNIGAWIMGRNMFGPIRGSWPDHNWKGWWGENPPYHVPVYILTNHKRDPIEMEGGTIFYFVTNGIYEALKHAFDAAKGKDVRVGGGVDTIRQYLKAKLVDELHIAISPILLGQGENLFSQIDLLSLGYKSVKHEMTDNALHVIIKKASS